MFVRGDRPIVEGQLSNPASTTPSYLSDSMNAPNSPNSEGDLSPNTLPNPISDPLSNTQDSLDSHSGYSSQATHQRLPNETAEEYQHRRHSLELETETRRLNVAKRNARAARTSLTTARLINGVYFLIGALETLLILRLILRLSGANSDNAFASFIYNLSEPFVASFSTLFVSPTAEGARYIFDVNLLVAMLVYGLLGLLVARLIKVLAGDITR
jgi:YggT family protein